MGHDVIELDDASLSGFTTLSTHNSLKRKSISPPSTCHNISNSVISSNNTKCLKHNNVVKDDYNLLFPTSASDKNLVLSISIVDMVMDYFHVAYGMAAIEPTQTRKERLRNFALKYLSRILK